MSIIKEEYKELGTKLSLLSDTVVLAQAWKKAHAYIRRYNWYADVLELDVSAVNLDECLTTWAREIKSDDYVPETLRVVPAPKNCKWVFAGDEWKPKPKDKDDGVPLRPLAHLPIREQVLNTAVMLCLANPVETAQGCPELEPLEARKKGVASYGNRLHCQWREGVDGELSVADHSWGSSKCYSEYFEHYQKFLSRPVTVCQSLSAELRHDRELYVVKLDLKSFFDKVDVSALGRELMRIDQAHRDKVGCQSPKKDQVNHDQFWLAVERLFKWDWDKDDCPESVFFSEVDGEDCIPRGVPQGMVASGFLANAYLNQFDIKLTQQCAENMAVGDVSVELLDYCRYVDDIRLVVSAPILSDVVAIVGVIREAVERHIDGCLAQHQVQISATRLLELNKGKTEVQAYKSIGLGTGISTQMRAMNAGLSGTFDLDGLVETAGGLDGLLWLSEQLESDDDSQKKNYKHRLAKISLPASDVRDDTVKRFVATRIVKALREQLAMADLDAPAEDAVRLGDKVLTRDQLSHEFERAARRFIKLWAGNPSLIILLRCAFDLFPHAKLLEPVRVSLTELLESSTDETVAALKKKRLAFYVIADLLRAGAVETGYREAEAYPEGSDIEGYRECLTLLAKRMLQRKISAPWYVQQQAYLYLSSQNDVSKRIVFKGALREVKSYLHLQQMLRYRDIAEKDLLLYLPFVLVVQQIKPDRAKLATWLLTNLEGCTAQIKNEVASFLISAQPALLVELLSLNKKLKTLLIDHLPECVKLYVQGSLRKRKALPLPAAPTLLQALVNQDNPFANENGLLALAQFLLKDCIKNPTALDLLADGISSCDVSLKRGVRLWDDLTSLPEDFWVDGDEAVFKATAPSEAAWGLYDKPEWVSSDKLWMYGLGRLLRSAFVGDIDFTARQWLIRDEVSPYSGLRSTWYQRRFGMSNAPQALLTEGQPVTPWLSGFLTALLQWPGTLMMEAVAHEVGKVTTPQQLLKIVDMRIKVLRGLYGHRSKTPFVVMPISDAAPRLRPMRVAVVQTMRPKLDEFDAKDPLHWTSAELAAHRRHLAEMCKLTHAQVRAWMASRSKAVHDENGAPLVDLVLFPELSVHPQHLGFLRRLSDSLRATIFAGLTFVHSANAGGVVNQGVWLLRTQRKGDGRRLVYVRQGKKFPMKLEQQMGIKPHRPDVTLVEFPVGEDGKPTRVAAAICFDATDLDLVADLRERSDVFLVAALNKDVGTFDNMVGALRFHMYQPVILANSGEFGGSTAQAPYTKHDQLITHMHGGNQVAVSVFEIEPWDFNGKTKPVKDKEVKSPPAGFEGRNP
ncbi:MAG: hypothetical protein RL459_817 [Pseudomonadota bacterium]|jgi:hypothetical protein